MTFLTGILTVFLMLPFTVLPGSGSTPFADSHELRAGGNSSALFAIYPLHTEESIPTDPRTSFSTLPRAAGTSRFGLEDTSDAYLLRTGINPTSDISFTNLHSEFLHQQIAQRYYSSSDPDHLVFGSARDSHPNAFLNTIAGAPGYGFLASLLVPGLGQAANRQYWKTGLMLALEATAITLLIDASNRGNRLERRYQRIGDENWSVVKYTAWVHNYYHTVPGARAPGAPDIPASQLLTP